MTREMYNKKKTYARRKRVVSIIEYTIRIISVIAFFALMLSAGTMIETWSMAGKPLVVCILSLAWFAQLGAYDLLVNH